MPLGVKDMVAKFESFAEEISILVWLSLSEARYIYALRKQTVWKV